MKSILTAEKNIPGVKRFSRNGLIIFRLYKKSFYLLLLFSILLPAIVLAQATVMGTVKDESGAGLFGASVSITGDTTIGTITNASGNFTLHLPAGRMLLTVTSIGYQSQNISVNNRANIIIVLVSDKMKLDEVVVTGYSNQKKKDITGSVAVVDMQSIKSIPAGSAMQALQGQASGVNVVSSGVPGAQSTIQVRGVTSFGNTQPLVLVDGIQTDMNTISADDIESIQVLKDAGAAAIYGVRGSNGVIVITTKKGKSGVPTISYHGYYGRQIPNQGSNPMKELNAPDYARLYKIVYPNTVLFANGIPDYMYGGAGGSGIGNEGDASVNPSKYVFDPVNPLNNYIIQKLNKQGTDWFHAFFKPAPTTSHCVTASGGTARSSYLFSLGYLNQEGTVIQTYMKRYSARINTQYKVRDNIRIGENVYIFYEQNPTFSNQVDFNTITQLYQMPPIVPVYDIKGNFGGTFGGPELGSRYNPVATLMSTVNNRHNVWDIVGNAYAEVDFLKHFTVRTSFGGTIDNQYGQTFSFTPYWSPTDYTTPNSYSESALYNSSSTWTNTLTYTNQLGKHNVKVLLGSEAIKNYGRSVTGGSRNFFSTNFDYLILNNGTSNVTNSSSAYTNTLFSLFSRLDYSFNDKYLLSATLRRDGSSVFGPEKRYGLFPSFSAGWRVSNENFMKGITWLNDLKLRGSYGVLGSQNNVSPTNSLTLYGGGFSNSYYDISGNGTLRRGFFQTNIGNPGTSWEQDVISNIGFDATFLNKISVSLEFYRKSVNGLLFTQPLLATAGGAAAPIINIGDIRNEGLDFTAKYAGKISRDLNFNVSANITSYKNTVINIPGPGYFDAASQQQLGTLVRNQEGHPVSSFFGYDVIGLFSSADDVIKSPKQDGAAPGRFKYRDVNGDGAITTSDRTFIGNPNPNFTYGVNLQVEYKGFDLSAFFYGSQGNKIINALKVNTEFFGTYLSNKSTDLLHAWTPQNTNTNIPKLESVNSFSTAQVMNSFFVEDGSYLRLKSLMLGYTINSATLKKLGITRPRVYLQAANLFTLTKYSGLDPELVGPSSSFGIDWGNYPGNFQNFLLGIDISF
jgi:TonB-linked SusC/RagA family outer membrane protein